MALSRVQGAPKATGNPGTITFSSPPSVGNGIVVVSVAWGGTTTPTCTDNWSNTYTTAITQSNGNPRVAILYCSKITATGTPFTITLTYNGQYSTAIEVAGISSDYLIVDQTASLTGSSTTPSTGTTAALTGTDVFAVIAHSFNSSLSSLTVESVVPAWTQEFEDLSWSQATGEVDSRPLTGVSGTTQSGSWTSFASSATWAGAIAVFKAGSLPPADVRLTSLYTEALTQNATADVRLTGLYAEALTQNATADIRLSSMYVEVLSTTAAAPVIAVEQSYPFVWIPM